MVVTYNEPEPTKVETDDGSEELVGERDVKCNLYREEVAIKCKHHVPNFNENLLCLSKLVQIFQIEVLSVEKCKGVHLRRKSK